MADQRDKVDGQAFRLLQAQRLIDSCYGLTAAAGSRPAAAGQHGQRRASTRQQRRAGKRGRTARTTPYVSPPWGPVSKTDLGQETCNPKS